MNLLKDRADIGIFFGRPERSHMLAEKLRDQGFRVTLYNRRGLPGTFVFVRYTFLPALLRLFLTKHRAYLTSLSFVPSFSLRLNMALRGLPYVFNATGLKSAMYRDRSARWRFPSLAERWLYPTLMNQVLAGASRIVCNSRYLQAKLGSQFPQHAHKMMTIYNGIDFDSFASGRRIPIQGIPAEAPKLLSTMTWDYEAKAAGARLLIDAMGLITERYPEARLIIAAKTSHSRYSGEIEDYLAIRPWKNSVRILYNQTNIADLLASSDLFVYASPPESNDSLPRALLEAHAAGLAVVATATAGCPEIVEDTVTGFLVSYDASLLATRVLDLVTDPLKRTEFGRRGGERVRELFAWDRMGEAYATVFREIVSGQAQAAKAKRLVEIRGGQS
ncbi:MAG: glycosyltransferase family 4 protein [Candidatus Binatia bacterium]